MMRLFLLHMMFFLLAFTCKTQTIQKNLLQANSFLFKNNITIYGFEQHKELLFFKCFSYSKQLVLNDSIEYSLGKHTTSDYLSITTDTLHGVINFYFQLANDKNRVSLLRVNDTLGKITSVENYDANHINSFTVFDNETYYYKNNLYVIKTNTDTSGIQFYLNKYQIKTLLKPFEYLVNWQFAFERHSIHRANIMYADSAIVLVYAHVNDGVKKGQWLLRIDAQKGTLIAATRLGSKLANKHFLYSNSLYDKKEKTMYVVGSTYEYAAIDFKKQTSDFINLSKRHQLFLIAIDSLGEVVSRSEKNIALPIQTNFGTYTNSYHLKIRSIKLNDDKSFSFWTDMYEQIKPNTFAYYTSWHFNAIPNEIDYDIVPSKMTIATKILPKFISINDADTHGKMMLKSISDYDKFKYKQPLNTVLMQANFDDLGNTFYVLKKTDILQGTKQYSHVFISKKGLEQKTILSTIKEQQANLYFIKNKTYISFITTSNNTAFELKLNTL